MAFFIGKATKKIITAEHTIELDSSAIRDMLNEQGAEIPEDAEVRIFVGVPGGGDWSNMDLSITKDCPVRVEWRTAETTDGG